MPLGGDGKKIPSQLRRYFQVAQVGDCWNQLVGELKGWLVFGKSMEKETISV
jgi:hypothetical protein